MRPSVTSMRSPEKLASHRLAASRLAAASVVPSIQARWRVRSPSLAQRCTSKPWTFSARNTAASET